MPADQRTISWGGRKCLQTKEKTAGVRGNVCRSNKKQLGAGKLFRSKNKQLGEQEMSPD